MAKQSQLIRYLAQLTEAEAAKRIDAAARLGRSGNREAVRPLISALSDSEYKVRRNAARSLGIIGDAWAVEPLIAALGDPTASVRKNAAVALGQIRDSHAVEGLCLALRDRKRTVRENAMEALVQIGAGAVGGLAQTVNAGRPEAQEAARYALVMLYEKDKQQTAGRILSDPKLTPLERFQALEAIKNARPKGFMAQFSQWIGSVPQFCSDIVSVHRFAGTVDTAECKGAEAVLQFLTLVRAGQRNTAEEASELLRGSSVDNTAHKANELLRGSHETPEPAPPAERPSFWKRLFNRRG